MALRKWLAGIALLSTFGPMPALAEVIGRADNGFTVRAIREVSASPEEAWKAIVHPAGWWLDEHTFSGKAANLTLNPVAGGCFCETLPVPKDVPAGQKPGGVEHMRVIYANPGHALRLTGALGPLQSEAVAGTLTITLKREGKATRILWEYVVGGYMRYPIERIAPAVDKVITAQLSSLALKLGPATTFDLAPGKDKAEGPQGDAADAQMPGPEAGEAPGDSPHKQANDAVDSALSPQTD
ncbi:SRPBCC family protein [Novosphingobium sp. ZN18A2]|uniref:SRPBCC family protein n=1 Tax=Novosphingobium sp. ZN18A2 TaxID=3079861 RepID=UPI0030D3DAD3